MKQTHCNFIIKQLESCLNRFDGKEWNNQIKYAILILEQEKSRVKRCQFKNILKGGKKENNGN